jgi:hypothetical protein
METAGQRPIGLIVITVLGLVQGIMGVLRALAWFQAGIAITGQGILILPLVGRRLLSQGRAGSGHCPPVPPIRSGCTDAPSVVLVGWTHSSPDELTARLWLRN